MFALKCSKIYQHLSQPINRTPFVNVLSSTNLIGCQQLIRLSSTITKITKDNKSYVIKFWPNKTKQQVFQHRYSDNNSEIIINLQIRREFNSQYRAKRKSTKFRITPLDKNHKMEWPKITLFGDSITRRSMDPDNGCWGSMLAYRFGEYFDIDVRGFEGYNTKWALGNVEKLFPKSYLDKVEVFNIFFGHNDSWVKDFALHVPVDEYEKNMLSIIKYLNDNGIENRKIILITPTWFHKEETNKHLSKTRDMTGITMDKHLDEAKQYSEAILKIAMEKKIDVIDFFDVSLNYPKLEDMFCDGIHFSKVGAKLLYDLLMPVMEKKLESRYKKPIGDLWHLPPFDQIPEVKEQLEMIAKLQLESKSEK